jgi:hypothetical protein
MKSWSVLLKSSVLTLGCFCSSELFCNAEPFRTEASCMKYEGTASCETEHGVRFGDTDCSGMDGGCQDKWAHYPYRYCGPGFFVRRNNTVPPSFWNEPWDQVVSVKPNEDGHNLYVFTE